MMDIKDAKKLRIEIENEIGGFVAKKLTDFVGETGLSVNGISIDLVDTTSLGGDKVGFVVGNVDIDVMF